MTVLMLFVKCAAESKHDGSGDGVAKANIGESLDSMYGYVSDDEDQSDAEESEASDSELTAYERLDMESRAQHKDSSRDAEYYVSMEGPQEYSPILDTPAGEGAVITEYCVSVWCCTIFWELDW